jgi:heme/copper-type cytochrome/quinol oxidase subunit 2
VSTPDVSLVPVAAIVRRQVLTVGQVLRGCLVVLLKGEKMVKWNILFSKNKVRGDTHHIIIATVITLTVILLAVCWATATAVRQWRR